MSTTLTPSEQAKLVSVAALTVAKIKAAQEAGSDPTESVLVEAIGTAKDLPTALMVEAFSHLTSEQIDAAIDFSMSKLTKKLTPAEQSSLRAGYHRACSHFQCLAAEYKGHKETCHE